MWNQGETVEHHPIARKGPRTVTPPSPRFRQAGRRKSGKKVHIRRAELKEEKKGIS